MTTQKQLSECGKCGRKSEIVMLGQQCPFCDKVNPLQKELEAFEKKFVRESVFGISIGAIDSFKGTAKNQVREFLRQSLNRYARSVIEQAMPEERGTKNYNNSHEAIMNGDKDYGFNACRKQLQENVERVLGNNEQ